MVKIAIDMMGGDDAPGIVLEAVEKAVNDFKDLEIILFGDQNQYTLNHERIEFRHCSEKIEMEDEPVRAIKRKKDSSMVRMAEAVKMVKRMDVCLQVIPVRLCRQVYSLLVVLKVWQDRTCSHFTNN